MPKVLFTETRVVQDEHRGTPNETRYEAGKVYDLPAGSVAHWMARGVATDDVHKIAAAAPAERGAAEKERAIAKAEAEDAAAADAHRLAAEKDKTAADAAAKAEADKKAAAALPGRAKPDAAR